MKPAPPDFLNAKPFLKWAGGKRQLIPAIASALPKNMKAGSKFTYIEPFVGSGAIMFWILQNFPGICKAVINDINEDLINAYIIIKTEPYNLINALHAVQSEYFRLVTEEDRKSYFLDKRENFNTRRMDLLQRTAQFIFLNRTCFNGLYRVNSNNLFNVPFGKYTKPKICDPETIMADSAVLQKITILKGDYHDVLKHATTDSFFYLDPPYKPISKTSSFNTYAKDTFDDNEQVRLKHFCDRLTSENHQWLLSNSDPKNVDPENNFFEKLYSGKGVYINRVKATRNINSNPAKRGSIYELLISNYEKRWDD